MGLLVHVGRIEPGGGRLPIGIYWILRMYTFRNGDKWYMRMIGYARSKANA